MRFFEVVVVGLICFFCFIFGRLRYRYLRQRMDYLENGITKIEKDLIVLKSSLEKSSEKTASVHLQYKQEELKENVLEEIKKTEEHKKDLVLPPLSAFDHDTTSTPIQNELGKAKQAEQVALLDSINVINKQIKNRKSWGELESQFSGTITGIVGSLAVVLGVVFLGVYAAIQLGPLGRFGVVCSFSIGLYALYFFLQRKDFWRGISLWIRSASGIVFLMGCIGSVGIETMKWVQDPWSGLGLVCLGLIANLVFGFLNGGQIFASLHVLFSLFALSVVPVNATTFSIAALVTFCGIIMSSQNRRWDQHLIVTLIGFTALHFYWFYSLGVLKQEFPVPSLQAMFLCVVVGGTALLSHYRKIYATSVLQNISVLAHIITWIALGVNLYLHVKGSMWGTFFLTLSTFFCFGMAERARKLCIEWLCLCDRCVALLLALLTVFSLKKFGLSGYEISSIAVMVVMIYIRVVLQIFEKTIFKISCVVLLLVYGVLAAYTLILVSEANFIPVSSFFFSVANFLVLGWLGYPYIHKKVQEKKEGFVFRYRQKKEMTSFSEIPFVMQGLFSFLLVVNTKEREWLCLIPMGMNAYNLILREKRKSAFLDFTTLFGVGFSFFIFLIYVLMHSSLYLLNFVLTSGMLGLGIIAWKKSESEYFEQKVVWPGIGMIWATVTVASYVFIESISSVLPGILWLFFFLVSAEWRTKKSFLSGSSFHNRSDVFISYFGLLSLFLFLIRFFLVDVSNQAIAFDFVRVRYFSEAFSLGTILYYLVFACSWHPSRNTRLKGIGQYFVELFLVTVATYILFEVENRWYSVMWSVGSFSCYFIGKRKKEWNRLILYGYFFFFSSLFQITFISTTIATPSLLLFDQAWLTSLVSIYGNTAFLILIHQDQKQNLGWQVDLPRAVRWLSFTQTWIEKMKIKLFLYSLFISVGCFLFWSFDKSLLSLLWGVQCFILFLISILLREPQFRMVSMISIAFVFLRIIFYDLTGSNFFIKAVVFISVGAILIAMNIVYNKYKDRYETK